MARPFLYFLPIVLLTTAQVTLAGGDPPDHPPQSYGSYFNVSWQCLYPGYAQATVWANKYEPEWVDYDLRIDGQWRASLNSGNGGFWDPSYASFQPTYLTLDHNRGYNFTVVDAASALNGTWQQTQYHYAPYCPPPPSVTLYQYTNYGGWYTHDTWMPWNGYLYMHWPATNASYCTRSWAGGTVSPSGADYSVPQPGYGGGGYYTVTCYGPGGAASDSVWIGREHPPAPYVMLYHSINGATWNPSDAWMPWNGSLAIHTSTASVSSCSGSYHNAGLSVDYNPTLPGYGTGMYYTVTCYGPGGSTSDSVWIGRQVPPPPPTTAISASPTSILVGQSSNITYYSGGTATGCVLQEQTPGGSYGQIHTNAGGSSSISRTLSTAGTWNYRAYCSGPGGSSAWTYASVNVSYPPPAANIQVRKTGTSTWLDSLTMNPGEQIEIGWNQNSSANTTSCSAVPPSYNFATGNAISGIDSDVTEPIGNTSNVYRLICHGQGGTQAVDNVTVTTNGGVGARFCDRETFVARGKNISVCWELGTNDPAMCSITAGSAEVLSPLPTANGTVSHLMMGEVTFDLECIGGDSDSMTVKVLPDLQET